MMFVKLWLDITLLSKIAAEDNGLLSIYSFLTKYNLRLFALFKMKLMVIIFLIKLVLSAIFNLKMSIRAY